MRKPADARKRPVTLFFFLFFFRWILCNDLYTAENMSIAFENKNGRAINIVSCFWVTGYFLHSFSA